MVRELDQREPLVQGAHAVDLRQPLGVGLVGGNLRAAGVQQAVQIVGIVGGEDRVMVDEVEQRRRDAALGFQRRRDVGEGDGPVARRLGADEAEVCARPCAWSGARD